MSTATLELTDASGNEIFTKPEIKNSISDNSEDESIERIHKENCLSKLYLFIKRYLKQLKHVFQSIIPDLKSFKYWQILVLILYATFSVVFSILVKNNYFYILNNFVFSRILIHFFLEYKNVLC
jgi:hypothetical protein